MTVVAPKDTRLVARVPQDVQEFVKNAAEVSGASLSQFIVQAVTEKAKAIIEKENAIMLTMKGAEQIFEALENPPKTNENLLQAARRFKENGGFSYVGSTTIR
jgi:uncharacterized protein (DUF1778 family)